MTSNTNIPGCTALVTGATGDLGRGIVDALRLQGADRIYVTGRDETALAALCEVHPEKLEAVHLDVTLREGLPELAEKYEEVDVLINCAGVCRQTRLMQPEGAEAAVQQMEVNCFGLLSICRAFAPILAGNGGGAIVNFLSLGALVSHPVAGSYCVSKAAAHSVTQSLRGELFPDGTRVIGVYPAAVESRIGRMMPGPRDSVQTVVQATLEALAAGTTWVFPGEAARFRDQVSRDPEALERELAHQLPESLVD